MTIQMIPLNQLVPSPANVRKTGAGIGIDELAASIKAHGLLQNLQVRPRGKDKFEVVAGGRRLAALKLLVKQKHLAKDFEIACHVLDTEDAGEISLAENTVRVNMHPADQFAAFHALAESGKGHEEIAARFGVAVAVVRQRLKLACVSPSLFDLYRGDQMTLDQLMAFTVSENHAAQEAAWFDQPEWNRRPDTIRRTLTAAHVETDDERVLFVGLTAYQAAGGEIVRDLFQPDHEGYLTDPVLLDRLVAARLTAEAAAVQAEGWKWVEIMPDLDWDTLRRFGRVDPSKASLSAERQEERDSLISEYDSLTDDDTERAEAIDARLDAIEAEAETWRSEDKAAAGAFVAIGRDGQARIERGLIRPDEKARPAHIEGEDDKAGAAKSPLPARLIEDLTAERTAALRAMMGENEAVALAAVAHALALPVFYSHAIEESCLGLRLRCRDLRSSAEHIEDSKAAALTKERRAAWVGRLPQDSADLFGWLQQQDAATVTSLIAFCAAQSVDAVRGKSDRAASPRLVHADRLAEAVGLDMTAWWQPTGGAYLGRVPKALILEAVSEGVSKQAAENLMHLKKDILITRAGERLAGKGWLPKILRQPAEIADEEVMPEIDEDDDMLALAAE